MGFDGDGFDYGSIDLGAGGLFEDGHFIFDQGIGDLIGFPPNRHNLNGVRPALWLKD